MILLDGFIMHKHGQIRLYGIPDHIADLKRGLTRIIQADHRAIILNADIKLPAVTVCEGDNLLLISSATIRSNSTVSLSLRAMSLCPFRVRLYQIESIESK